MMPASHCWPARNVHGIVRWTWYIKWANSHGKVHTFSTGIGIGGNDNVTYYRLWFWLIISFSLGIPAYVWV